MTRSHSLPLPTAPITSLLTCSLRWQLLVILPLVTGATYHFLEARPSTGHCHCHCACHSQFHQAPSILLFNFKMTMMATATATATSCCTPDLSLRMRMDGEGTHCCIWLLIRPGALPAIIMILHHDSDSEIRCSSHIKQQSQQCDQFFQLLLCNGLGSYWIIIGAVAVGLLC